MARYWGIDNQLFDNYRFKQLSHRQQNIFIASMLCDKACKSYGTGIFFISTGSFSHIKEKDVEDELGKKIKVIDIEDVQDELGRSSIEISLKKYNKIIPLSADDEKEKAGLMVSKFPDLIEYDPQKDIINNKLMFRYVACNYLKGAKMKIEAIINEYEITRLQVEERWWGEFMNINKDIIKDAWQEYFEKFVKEEDIIKGKNKIYLTFQKLLELKEKYQDYKPLPKISVLNAEKASENQSEFTI